MWTDRYENQPRKGADILVQALEREGVDQVFAYPGGASMEIHQALTRSPTIQNYLCRHEQVWIHAADFSLLAILPPSSAFTVHQHSC